MKEVSSKKITSNIIWAFGERISAQLVSLLVTVVLARLLSPDEYAVVGIVTIFIGIANVFVTSGYGVSLIQKHDADELDFSTTLIFSVSFSLVLYVVLFFGAKPIAYFYELPQLVPVVRIMAIRLVFAAINTVQHAYISKQMAFKKFFFSTSIGTVVSAIIGIYMAYMGFGVWALVAQYMTNSIMDTIVLGITSTWKPKMQFSLMRMKRLFSYGSKLLLSDLASNLYAQMRGLLMSKFYHPTDLSYYSQADKYTHIFINNIEVSLHKVLFQATADAQKDLARVKQLTRKTVKMANFVLCPIQLGLATTAHTWVPLLLTEKWLPCVPHIQILCLMYLMNPIIETHTRNIKALGYGNLLLKVMLMRYGVGILMLVLTAVLFNNPVMLTAVAIPTKLFAVILCGIIDKKITGYRLREQMSDMVLPCVNGAIMGAMVLLAGLFVQGLFVRLVLQITVGIIVYAVASVIFNRRVTQSFFAMGLRVLKIKK